jgi:uncharacterized protein YeeX (DUF496 family)
MEWVYILKYIVIASFILIVLSYLFLFKIYERFENSVESDYEKIITDYMTVLSESLCPATELAINTFLEKTLWIVEEDITYGDKPYMSTELPTLEECTMKCELDPSCKGLTYVDSMCDMRRTMDYPILKGSPIAKVIGITSDPDKSHDDRKFGIAAKRPAIVLPGTKEQKRMVAYGAMMKVADGTILVFTVSPNPYEIPLNINDRIMNSIKILNPFVTLSLNAINAGLQCDPNAIQAGEERKTKDAAKDAQTNGTSLTSLQSSIPEGFYGNSMESFLDEPRVCSKEEITEREKIAKENAAKESAKQCTPPKELTNEQKIFLLKNISSNLKLSMNNPYIIKALMEIKDKYNTLNTIKEKAKKGDLKPNCPEINTPLKGYTPFKAGPNPVNQLNSMLSNSKKNSNKSKSSNDDPNDLSSLDPNSKKMLSSLVGMIGQFRSIG